jgi:hypothetical protein
VSDAAPAGADDGKGGGAVFPAPRVILYHKQGASARTRFLRFPHGVLTPGPLPTQSVARDEGSAQAQPRPLPAAWVREVALALGVADDQLRADPDYYAEADTPDGTVPVLLAEFTTLDPPFALAESYGGKFVALTEARGLPPVELEFLRRAYQTILG